MMSSIWDLTGTPQDRVDWTNPDVWIKERLNGEQKKLAFDIWHGTERLVNPRHIRGPKFLIDGYTLLAEQNGKYLFTEKGKVFISDGLNDTEKHIDQVEGCVFILRLVSNHRTGTRSTYFEEWKDYLLENSNWRTTSMLNDSLTRRLKNLYVRGLIEREGNTYSITSNGEEYLNSIKDQFEFTKLSEESDFSKDVIDYNLKQKEILKKNLLAMNPFRFEEMIRDLLIAMGYEDVEVTSPTNDKGVDVVGVIQNGISSVKEVIQVKRAKSNIGRKILDALRGSLHRFDAFQGTIITTSDFSKGTKNAAFEVGVSPITLINSEELIELLMEYEIGIRKKTTTYYSVDFEYFEEKLVDDNNAK